MWWLELINKRFHYFFLFFLFFIYLKFFFKFYPQYLIPEGITNYRRWNSGQHYERGFSHDAAAKLLRNKMELNRWMVTEIRWSRCAVSLTSPVQSAIRRPSSSRKERPRSLIGPNILKIIGQKQDVFESSTYFTILCSDAISMAPPTITDVVWMYDAATVLTIDTSHVRFLPACHGMSVKPSGRLLSVLNSPLIIIIIIIWDCHSVIPYVILI